jgi:hypothetical protein
MGALAWRCHQPARPSVPRALPSFWAGPNTRNLFTLTDKSFETLLETVQTDKDAAARLREWAAPTGSTASTRTHEHSVEFQTLLLKHRHPNALISRSSPSSASRWARRALTATRRPSGGRSRRIRRPFAVW